MQACYIIIKQTNIMEDFILNFNENIFENNDIFDIFSRIEINDPNNKVILSPSIVINQNQTQTETNETTLNRKDISDIINANHEIEMVCPFVGRKRLRKFLDLKRKVYQIRRKKR